MTALVNHVNINAHAYDQGEAGCLDTNDVMALVGSALKPNEALNYNSERVKNVLEKSTVDEIDLEGMGIGEIGKKAYETVSQLGVVKVEYNGPVDKKLAEHVASLESNNGYFNRKTYLQGRVE